MKKSEKRSNFEKKRVFWYEQICSLTIMDYNERKKIRKELSNFKKKMDEKGIEMLLNRSGNEDIKLKLENGTITSQEAEEFLKLRLNGITSIKIKGKGRFVEPNEQVISMAKHNLTLGNKNNLLKIFEEILQNSIIRYHLVSSKGLFA